MVHEPFYPMCWFFDNSSFHLGAKITHIFDKKIHDKMWYALVVIFSSFLILSMPQLYGYS